MRTNRRELAIEIEATPGTPETLVSGDLLVRTRDGDTATEDVDQFDTEEVQGTSSKRPLLPGRKLFDATMSYILRSPASQTTESIISDLLRSAMFVSDAVKGLDIGAVTGGPFVDGETITGGNSGATGTVFRDTANGASEIKYTDVSGTFQSGETLTGGTSGATATTSSTENDRGYRYKPADSNFDLGGGDSAHHVTARFRQDGWYLEGSGCLSNLQMLFEVGKPCVVTQRLLGRKSAHGDQALVLPSSYPEDGNAVPRFLSATLDLGGYTPTDIRSMTLSVETNPEAREDAQDSNGVLYADYQKDAPTLTLDPAHVLAATNDFFQDLEDGTTLAVSWNLGSVAGSIWTFYADEAQYSSVDLGAERTLATLPIELRLNGHLNDELIIWQH